MTEIDDGDLWELSDEALLIFERDDSTIEVFIQNTSEGWARLGSADVTSETGIVLPAGSAIRFTYESVPNEVWAVRQGEPAAALLVSRLVIRAESGLLSAS